MVRKHVFVSGKVQGVYFRAFTEKTARKYNVKGWVRNTVDGRVEAVLEGGREAVNNMLVWFWEGSPFSRVQDVEVDDEKYVGEFKDFSTRY